MKTDVGVGVGALFLFYVLGKSKVQITSFIVPSSIYLFVFHMKNSHLFNVYHFSFFPFSFDIYIRK